MGWDMQLKDKVILITGVGPGIGRAVAVTGARGGKVCAGGTHCANN